MVFPKDSLKMEVPIPVNTAENIVRRIHKLIMSSGMSLAAENALKGEVNVLVEYCKGMVPVNLTKPTISSSPTIQLIPEPKKL